MGLVNVRSESLKVKLPLAIAAGLLVGLALAVWFLVRHPLVTLALGVACGAVIVQRMYGWPALAIPAAIVLVLLTVWRIVHLPSFRLWVWWPFKGMWRRHVVYRPDWRKLMLGLELTTEDGDEHDIPALLSVRSTASTDRVRIKLLPGQVLDDYAQHAHRIAACFEAVDCRVRSVARVSLVDAARRFLVRFRWFAARIDADRPVRLRKRIVELWMLTSDPLTKPTALFEVPALPALDLAALPVALREDGLAWTLRLIANHTLIVGATGAGKGSVLWSIVRALGNGIRTKLVELWVIDPKGGMEFAAGQRLFARYCYGDDHPATVEDIAAGKSDKTKKRAFETAYAEFLEDAVDILRTRQSRLRGWLRTHKPTPDDPLIVIMIDEIASLTAYVTDRDVKKRIASALSILLSQGRAVGVLVIGAGQDARKETIDMRGLFPNRIAMRLIEVADVDMVLGDGARDRGARCDEIPFSLPGTAYVVVETLPEPIRVRFGYVDDPEIDVISALYEPGAPEPSDFPPPPTRLRRDGAIPTIQEDLKEAA